MNAIYTRRSVRSFKETKVEKDKIEKLLRAAMQAPSASNQQPWEFIVIESQEGREKVASMSPYASPIKKAPLAIIVLGNAKMIKWEGLWQQDLGAATQNLMLEAVEQGLGTVWIGVWGSNDTKTDIDNSVKLKEILDLPDHIRPYAAIAVGYPEKEDANKFVERYDASRVHFEEY